MHILAYNNNPYSLSFCKFGYSLLSLSVTEFLGSIPIIITSSSHYFSNLDTSHLFLNTIVFLNMCTLPQNHMKPFFLCPFYNSNMTKGVYVINAIFFKIKILKPARRYWRNIEDIKFMFKKFLTSLDGGVFESRFEKCMTRDSIEIRRMSV